MEAPGLIVVYPAALLGWEVLVPECDEPHCFDDREQAIQFARQYAESAPPACVRVEDWYGHLESQWCYAASDSAASAVTAVTP